MRRGQALAEIVLKLQIVSPRGSGGHVCRGRAVVSGSPCGLTRRMAVLMALFYLHVWDARHSPLLSLQR